MMRIFPVNLNDEDISTPCKAEEPLQDFKKFVGIWSAKVIHT